MPLFLSFGLNFQAPLRSNSFRKMVLYAGNPENVEVLIMEQFSNADNQQASLCDLSWLGGIVDGEGCITVDKRSARNQTDASVTPMVTIVNTDMVLIEKVIQVLKDQHLAYYYRVHPPKGNWKQKIEIVISGIKRVVRFLDVMLPYLIGKYQRAVLLQQFCNSRKGHQRPYSDYEKGLCAQIWKLNGRGTSHWHTKASTTTRTTPVTGEDIV